jgi:DNA ligase 1
MEYKKLTAIYHQLERTTKRLEKAEIIAECIKKNPEDSLAAIIHLLQGRVFPQWDKRKIGFSAKLMMKALAKAAGRTSKEIEHLWSKQGDLGSVAEDILTKKQQATLTQKKLTTEKLIMNIQKLTELEGTGTVERKVGLVAELLSSASPEEARFVVRTVLEQLRVGVADGIIRDAIAQAFNKEINHIETAFHVKGDYGEVAILAKQNNLKKAIMIVGKPIQSMLAILVSDIEEAFEACGTPALLEYKLDGFRLQIHKDAKGIKLFTRRGENVTKQFPDVMETVKKHVKGKTFIIDVEAVGYNPLTKKYLPFQQISQRIKRKYNIQEMAKKFPVEVNVFDVLLYNGTPHMATSQEQRRTIIENIITKKKGTITTTKKIITSSISTAKKFYKESLQQGHEGLIIKTLQAHYQPGRYVEGWVKLKPTLEPLDLVIVGAEAGTGKRAGMLTTYVLACRSGSNFLSCGMVSTGLKEKEEQGTTFHHLSKLLKPLIIKTTGRQVTIKPKIVVEVAYEEIQKSPTYTSGYALRFPRFKALRTKEKGPHDINTLEDIEHIYSIQKKRNK